MQRRVYVLERCLSIPARANYRKAAAAGLLLWAQPAGDTGID